MRGSPARSPAAVATVVAVLAAVIAAVAIVAAIVIVNAPANWLALYLADRTDGVVLLADAQGTIWSGSAVMALGAFGPAAGVGGTAAADAGNVTGLALPGRITWTMEIERSLAPVLHLTHDGVLLQPLAVRYRDGGLQLGAGAAALPASMLRLAGAPLNTLLPEGRCTLRWDGLHLDGRNPPTGEGSLQIADFALAISPVRPLGDYRMSWSSGERGLSWQLTTEHGPLELQGAGSFVGRRGQARVVVKVARDAPAAAVAQLNPLLDMLGRRGPDEAVIETGKRS